MIIRRKHLVLAVAVAFAQPVPFMAWSGQDQPELQSTPSSDSGSTKQGGMQQDSPSAEERTSAGDEQESNRGAINPEDYLHKDAVNTKGDKVGVVDMLVTSRTGTVEAVIDIGGFLVIGEQKIVVPIGQLQPKDGMVLVYTTLTDDQLKRATQYKRSDFSAFETEPQDHQALEKRKNQ